MRNYYLFLTLCLIVIASCMTTKPPITKISDKDEIAPIIFFYDDNWCAVSPLTNPKTRELIDLEKFEDKLPNSFDLFYTDISMNGRYLAVYGEIERLIYFTTNLPNEFELKIYDIQKSEFVFEDKTSKTDLKATIINWSLNNNGFYFHYSDTIKYGSFDGKCHTVMSIEDINRFKVSPSEKDILIYHDDIISIYNIENKSLTTILEVGRILGINLKDVSDMVWCEDESKLCFSDGRNIYIYDYVSENLEQYKAEDKIYDIDWLNKKELVYVTGHYPSELSKLDTRKEFQIYRLNIKSKESQLLHERINHDPRFINVCISPSKELLLFSEKDLHGPYTIKIMTIDGLKMNGIIEGEKPEWQL